ncbi:MAG: exodeoxyribonuclease III [Firmicutes bacterium]|nr:exodeoxyribonuclease III [Bacillota bacterium]MCL2770928.1 exodeoxyribonuclease III [Bacillota bacterium]
MRIVSLNINGIRAAATRGVVDFLKTAGDIICLQETKAKAEVVAEVLQPIIIQEKEQIGMFAEKNVGAASPCSPRGSHSDATPAFHLYQNIATSRAGYSGVAVLTKEKPISVSLVLPHQTLLQNEGRILVLEYEKFILVNAYVPHGGSRQEVKDKFFEEFIAGISELEKKKPIILAGDINVAHTELDCSHPKVMSKLTGFFPHEREYFGRLLETCNLVDTFRHLNPESKKHTWSSYRTKELNYQGGYNAFLYRIDYILISEVLKEKLKESDSIHKPYYSDHYALYIDLE